MNICPNLAGGFELNHDDRPTMPNVERFVESFDSAWQHAAADQKEIQTAYTGRAKVWLEHCAISGVACTGRPDQGHNYLMRVNSAVAFDLPGGNPGLTLLIGEELAHAFLIATGDPTHVPILRGREAEEAAQDVMKRWGFDMAAHGKLIAWVASHCKNGVWDRLPWR
jgi:hypothetical protein